MDNNGKYECYCHYVDGEKTGDGYFGEEGCNEILVETCGTEAPTDGAAKENTADSDKKEESKSDGCSMLFI